MNLVSADIQDLRTLYLNNLQKALDMEQKITQTLPTLIENASDPELSAAFQSHLKETRNHVSQIESLLRSNTGEVATETCKVINGLTTEALDAIKDTSQSSIRDIALIGAAQQVEHHEIAVYGTLRSWADILGLSNDVSVLKQIEAEEESADQLLTQVSRRVNIMITA